MTSLRVICGLGPPQSKILATRMPQTMSNYLCVKYLLIAKTTSTLAWAVEKRIFGGPHFGEFLVELPQQISGEKIAFAAQQLYTKLRFRCHVG